MRTLPALILSCALFAAQGHERRANDERVCEILKHRDQYIGRRFTVRGIVTQYEHGIYFVPYPDCAEHESGRVRDFPVDAYRRAGGTKGRGVIATIDVKIVFRPTALSVQRKDPKREIVLVVKRAFEIRPVPLSRR